MSRGALVIIGMLALSLVALNCSQDKPTAPTTVSTLSLREPAAPVHQASPNPMVIPPQAHPHGRTYGEWSMAWWQWLWSAPVAENPGLDETGDFVDYGQSGAVWFIAPNYGGVSERYATIPPGKMLFIDVAADFEATLIGSGETEAEMRALAAWVIDNIQSIELVIDGVAVENLAAYRVVSPEMFSFTLPEDNMIQFFGYDAPAGTYYPAISDGYFVMLAPLSAGEHTIYIATEYGEPFNNQSIVTLHITVARKH